MDIAQITPHPLIWAMPQREDVFFPGSFPFLPAWKTSVLYLLILATYENWRRRLVGSFKSLNWLSWFLQLVRLGHFWCQKDVVCIDHLVHDDDWSQWESWWPSPPSACSCRPRCEQSSSSGHANQVHPVKCHVIEVEPFYLVFETGFEIILWIKQLVETILATRDETKILTKTDKRLNRIQTKV